MVITAAIQHASGRCGTLELGFRIIMTRPNPSHRRTNSIPQKSPPVDTLRHPYLPSNLPTAAESNGRGGKPSKKRLAASRFRRPAAPRDDVVWETAGDGREIVDGVLRSTGKIGSASLPFVPEPGAVYRLSASVHSRGYRRGFSAIGSLSVSSAIEFWKNPGGYAWIA